MADYTNVTEEDIKNWGKDKIKDKVIDDTLGKIEDKYSDEFEHLGINADSIKTMYGYASGGGMTDGEISSELNLIYDLIKDTDAFGSFKDTKSFERIGNLKSSWETYGSDLVTLKKSMDTMSNQLETYGRYDADGTKAMEDALFSIINMSKSAMNSTIAGSSYGSIIDNTMGYVQDGFKKVEGAALERDLNYYNMDRYNEGNEDIDAFLSKMEAIDGFGDPSDKWADGPNLEELKAFYDRDTSNHKVIFNRYLRWRTQYEYDKTLRDIERKTGQSFFDDRSPKQKVVDAYHERNSVMDAVKAAIAEYKDCSRVGNEAIGGYVEAATESFVTSWLAGGGDKIVDAVKEYRDNWRLGVEMMKPGFDRFIDNWTIGAQDIVDWEYNALENWYYGVEDIYDSWKIGRDAISDGFHSFMGKIGNGLEEFGEDWYVGMEDIGDFFSDRYSDWKAGMKDILGFLHKNRNDVSDASKMRYDPLIIDVDGDGFNIENKTNGTNFDLDGNNHAEKINWTRKDGYLCLDLNKNGVIDNGRELFGDSTFIGTDGTVAKNGFEALAQYDLNGDGIIDSSDEIFPLLRVWIDADGSGTSEGELRSLEELGITAINLNYETTPDEKSGEAHIADTANVVYADGSFRQIGELWVSADLFDTVDNEVVEISEDIAVLPDVRGFGNISSLHNAMAKDESGKLKAIVEEFAAETDAKERKKYIKDILFTLCGADEIDDKSRGNNFSAKKLAVIETIMGEKYVGVNGSNPNPTAAEKLNEIYNNIENMYFNLMNSDTNTKPLIALLQEYTDANGTRLINMDAVQNVIDYMYNNGYENADSELYSLTSYLKFMDNMGVKGYEKFVMKNVLKGHGDVFSDMADVVYVGENNEAVGSNRNDYIFGSEEADIISGKNGNDVIIGGKGDDLLRGGNGNDSYVFNLGDGHDTIDEERSGTAADSVIFGEGITADDVVVTRDGNDMVLLVGKDGDSIRIKSQFTDYYNRIENFEFADGTVKNMADYYAETITMNVSGEYSDPDDYATGVTVINASDKDDVIKGNGRRDVIFGGAGDDKLYGGSGNDELHGGAGSDYLNGGND
ncbi:calcium-binding protein, partial [Ruminococcus flavefaciens]|uniref:calcium-binding protein n=1 Tax=Ruminococcus flavefaciens TaxID=1265 RepID=UPI000563138B